MKNNYLSKAIARLNRLYWENLPNFTHHRFFQSLDNISIDKPIFLLGTQGGGLTLLSRVIRRHSDIVSASGNSYSWCGRDELQNVAYASLPPSLRLGRRVGSFDIDHPLFGNNLAFAYATDPVISHYRLTEKDYNKKDADILEKIIKKKLRGYSISHSPRYVDKSQTYTLKIPFLKKCFPDAKFVLVSRNPYAICRGRTISDSKEDLKARCNHWVNTFSIATKDLSDTDHFFLRIEDFIENPSPIIDSLLLYLELPKQDNLLPAPNQKIPIGGVSKEKWYPILKDPNSKYLNALSKYPALIKLMSAELEPLAGTFNYKPWSS